MSDKNSQFVRLLSKYHQTIWAYVFTLHPNQADADDIMQETASSLWNRFDEFDPAKGEFKPWACRFAYYEVLRFRKTQSRSRLLFNDELLDAIADTQQQLSEELDPRKKVLSHCLTKLSSSDKMLVEGRYDPKKKIAALALELNIPVKRLYKRLEKVRLILFRCVDHELNKGGLHNG